MTHKSFHSEKNLSQFWHDFWELTHWQQKALQEDIIQTLHGMQHTLEASRDPELFYRYVHRNWQKPYFKLLAQSMTHACLVTRLMADIFFAKKS